MNIKNIVDKIPKESDVNPAEYTVADRIDDVNSNYMFLIEKATQIASLESISDSETNSETFTLVQGSNTFTRTIQDVPIFRVDFKTTGGTRWERLDEDQARRINGWCLCEMKFFASEKQIFVENARAGEIRITYARGGIVLFTTADYNAVTPPSPDWLPVIFHDLLWLEPALTMAEYYKKDRVMALRRKLERLQILFENHYSRNAVQNSKFESETDKDCLRGDNYR